MRDLLTIQTANDVWELSFFLGLQTTLGGTENMLECNVLETINQIKDRLRELSDDTLESQKRLFNGVALPAGIASLADVGVEDGTHLQVIIELRQSIDLLKEQKIKLEAELVEKKEALLMAEERIELLEESEQRWHDKSSEFQMEMERLLLHIDRMAMTCEDLETELNMTKRKVKDPHTSQELAHFDVAGDGFIQKDEIRAILRSLDPYRWTEEKLDAIDSILSFWDGDKNDCINFLEFGKWISAPKSHSVEGSDQMSKADENQIEMGPPPGAAFKVVGAGIAQVNGYYAFMSHCYYKVDKHGNRILPGHQYANIRRIGSEWSINFPCRAYIAIGQDLRSASIRLAWAGKEPVPTILWL